MPTLHSLELPAFCHSFFFLSITADKSHCITPPGLAEDFLQDYIQVNIGSLDLCANHNITQIIEICEDYEKEYK